jgi:drug/metabolite transporter (DMT)-like permease
MTTPSSSSSSSSIWPFVWLGVLAHLFIGSYPVFGKRAVAEVPKFSLVFIASLAIMIVGLTVLRWRDRVSWRQNWRTLRRERVLWLFALIVVTRTVTSILSIALTKAVWVQSINILAPFPAALLGVWMFGQSTPRYTYRALMLSTLGAVLMLVEDWSHVGADISRNDVLGLAFALISMLAFAFYYQLIRRSHVRDVTSGLIMFQQGLGMAIAFLILTVVTNEDWSAWTSVSTGGWLAVLGVIFVVQVGGNLSQIIAVGGVTPALITSFMALRLVSALVLGWLILGEQLVSPSQWLGATLVVGTVTGYLWLQKSDHRKRDSVVCTRVH